MPPGPVRRVERFSDFSAVVEVVVVLVARFLVDRVVTVWPSVVFVFVSLTLVWETDVGETVGAPPFPPEDAEARGELAPSPMLTEGDGSVPDADAEAKSAEPAA